MTTKRTTAHLSVDQLKLIDLWDGHCDGAKLVVNSRNNGTLELHMLLPFNEKPFRYDESLIARMHRRDHKAFWMLVKQAREYLAMKQAEYARKQAAIEFARTFPQQFPATKRALTSGRQMGHEVTPKPVGKWAYWGNQKMEPLPGYTTKAQRDADCQNVKHAPTVYDGTIEQDRALYRQALPEFSKIQFAGI